MMFLQISGIGMSSQSPMAFQSHDSNTGGGSNHSKEGGGGTGSSGDLEPSPEKPVTTPRTPTERKRKRKTNPQSGPSLMTAPTGPIPGDIMTSEAHKTNKPISEYFPKRAPSSPVRGGTKSPLSFGTIYPQSPKTAQYVSSPSGNTNNGPPLPYNHGDYYQQQQGIH